MEDYQGNTSNERLTTIPIETPYYNTIVDIQRNKRTYDYNYKPYDIFALGTKLRPKLNKLFTGCGLINIKFESLVKDNKIYIQISLYSGDKLISIKPEQKNHIQRLVDRCLNENPKHCALIHQSNAKIINPNYSDNWLRDILYYIIPNLDSIDISIKQQLSNLPDYDDSEPLDAKFSDGMLLVKFNPDNDYYTKYEKLYIAVIDIINDFYDDSVLSCSQDFAIKWSLARVDLPTDIQNIQSNIKSIQENIQSIDMQSNIKSIQENISDSTIGLYKPYWLNKYIFNRITFLTDRMYNPIVTIVIQNLDILLNVLRSKPDLEYCIDISSLGERKEIIKLFFSPTTYKEFSEITTLIDMVTDQLWTPPIQIQSDRITETISFNLNNLDTVLIPVNGRYLDKLLRKSIIYSDLIIIPTTDRISPYMALSSDDNVRNYKQLDEFLSKQVKTKKNT